MTVTLRDAFDSYVSQRTLSVETLRNYRNCFAKLKDWHELSLSKITPLMVVERYGAIRGNATANGTIKVLRAVLQYSNTAFEDDKGFPVLSINPASVINWRPAAKYQRLSTQELASWYQAIWSLDNSSSRDLMLMVLFCGLNAQSLMNLPWSNVDIEEGILRIDGVSIPLCDYTWQILRVRGFSAVHEHVFPGREGGPKKSVNQANQLVKRRSKVDANTYRLLATRRYIDFDLNGNLSKIITDSRSVAKERRARQRVTDELLRKINATSSTVAKQGRTL